MTHSYYHSSYNTRKFTELPYHSFKIDKKEYETSQYLTNLTWLHDKIDSTGCVQLLFDIYLISPPVQSNEMSPNARNIKLAEHIEFLIRFLQIHYKSLNYDAQQLNSLLSTFIKAELLKKSDLSSNSIIQRWQNEIKSGDVYIERLYIDDDENDDVEVSENDDECESNKNGYDFLINTNVNERFAISLSTDREEICVWNVLK